MFRPIIASICIIVGAICLIAFIIAGLPEGIFPLWVKESEKQYLAFGGTILLGLAAFSNILSIGGFGQKNDKLDVYRTFESIGLLILMSIVGAFLGWILINLFALLVIFTDNRIANLPFEQVKKMMFTVYILGGVLGAIFSVIWSLFTGKILYIATEGVWAEFRAMARVIGKIFYSSLYLATFGWICGCVIGIYGDRSSYEYMLSLHSPISLSQLIFNQIISPNNIGLSWAIRFIIISIAIGGVYGCYTAAISLGMQHRTIVAISRHSFIMGIFLYIFGAAFYNIILNNGQARIFSLICSISGGLVSALIGAVYGYNQFEYIGFPSGYPDVDPKRRLTKDWLFKGLIYGFILCGAIGSILGSNSPSLVDYMSYILVFELLFILANLVIASSGYYLKQK